MSIPVLCTCHVILIGHVLMKKQSQMSQTGEKSVWHLNEYINILYGLHYGAFGIFCRVYFLIYSIRKKIIEKEINQLADLDHVERSWKRNIEN